MATEQLVEAQQGEREAYAGVLRFYELAKRQEWQVRDLPWAELPPIPEAKGSPEKRARRKDVWRSVITQQLQADELACEMSSQLLNIAPDPEAKLYYSTMVQDESRHTEAWLKLTVEVGGTAARGPRARRPPGGIARARRQRRRAAVQLGPSGGGDADGRGAARGADPCRGGRGGAGARRGRAGDGAGR